MQLNLYRRRQALLHWFGIAGFAIFTFFFSFFAQLMVYQVSFTDASGLWESLLRALTVFLPERLLIDVPEDLPYSSLIWGSKVFGTMVMLLILAQVILELHFKNRQIEGLKKSKNHSIIIGFGASGQRLAKDLLAKNHAVIALEKHPDEQQRAQALNNQRLTLVVGDGSDATVLTHIGVQEAKNILIATDHDLTNLKALSELWRLLTAINNPPNLYVRLHDLQLLQQLRASDHKTQPQTLYFNDFQLIARRLFLDFPIYQWADWRGQAQVHVVLIGFSAMTEQLLRQLALISPYRDFEPLQVTIIAAQGTALAALQDRYQALIDQQLLTLRLIVDDFAQLPLAEGNAALARRLGLTFPENAPPTPLAALEQISQVDSEQKSAYQQSISAYFFCHPQDEINILSAKRLQEAAQRQGQGRAPAFIWVTDQKLLALSRPVIHTAAFAEIQQHFGMVERAARWEELQEQQQDAIAKLIHEGYQENYPDKDWQDLDEDKRQANRAAADHLAVKLHHADMYLPVHLDETGSTAFLNLLNFSGKVQLANALDAEALAENEHQRWQAERLLTGWRQAPLQADGTYRRDDNRRLHTNLLPFKDLPLAEQNKDREAIANLDHWGKPKIFKSLKLKLFPNSREENMIRPVLSLGLLPVTTISEALTEELFTACQTLAKTWHLRFLMVDQNQELLEMFKQEDWQTLLANSSRLQILSQPNKPEKDPFHAHYQIEAFTPEARNQSTAQGITRAQVYVIERAMQLFILGKPSPDLLAWRQDLTAIPEAFTSYPLSIREQRYQRMQADPAWKYTILD